MSVSFTTYMIEVCHKSKGLHLGLWNFTDYFKRSIDMGFEVYFFFFRCEIL